jgi:hypothetical protein
MSFDLKVSKGDLVLDSSGDLKPVENYEKLIQDVLKILSTQIGTHPFFPWYGSPITRALIGQSYEGKFVQSIASDQLRKSLERLQTLQKDQLRRAQTVTPDEQLAAVRNIKVERNPLDPRYYRILVTILTKAYRKVDTQVIVEL